MCHVIVYLINNGVSFIFYFQKVGNYFTKKDFGNKLFEKWKIVENKICRLVITCSYVILSKHSISIVRNKISFREIIYGTV